MKNLKKEITGKLTIHFVMDSGEIRFWDENGRKGIKGVFDPTRAVSPYLVNKGITQELTEAEFISLCDNSYNFNQ